MPLWGSCFLCFVSLRAARRALWRNTILLQYVLLSRRLAVAETNHSLQLNTSTLGHNILGSDDPSSTTTASAAAATATSTADKIGDWFTDIKDNVTDTIEDEFNDLVADIADKLAQELGIRQWYSLHLLDMCEGYYKPNATAKGASKNITSCSNRTAMCKSSLTQAQNWHS